MNRYFPRLPADARDAFPGRRGTPVDALRVPRSSALRAAAGLIVAVVLLGAGGCGDDARPAGGDSAQATGGQVSGTKGNDTGDSGAGAAGGAGVFGGTDRAWIEINIAMDEELLPLLALVPERGGARVKALSAEVSSFHEQELTALRALHDQAQLPAENPHKGMPMPGMVTPEQVTAAGRVRGAAFDTLIVGHLRAHFEQGVNLAESERKAGVEPQTKALADKVIESRRAFLSELG
ncbi:DUF305 domain-containing protein [Symbioplanes lichenis]|uniref:DUF305 domain-containing protein n=1 Tax=Symbioplanes lichenis TaxID=1629072 RepID=UPI00273918EB|nr:DUF305 domain-containing protein [Actinoplanes lichenis]